MYRLIPAGKHLALAASLVLVLVVATKFPNRTAAETATESELTNSLGMKFSAIPAGEFLMGATPDEITARKDQLIRRSGTDDDGEEIRKEDIAVVESEGPQHRVTISKPFRLGTYEVTQAEYQAVMGFNPSGYAATGSRRRNLAGIDTTRHPVDSVSWNDAVEFCRQLSSLDAEVAAGRSYRLPTEAEWEYACRAGTTTKFFWGDIRGRRASDWTEYPRIGTGNRATTVPVGGLKPNPWGLYDIQGNVREWCADWYDAKTYTTDAVSEPIGPATGTERVVRGGMSFYFPPAYRSAARRKYAPDATNHFIGFRVVCVQGEIPKVVKTASVPVDIAAQLERKGLVRQGTLYILAEEAELVRYTTALERLRVACFRARKEVDDAKQQLQRVTAAKAGTLQARLEARNMMRYSETWREHRNGVISRNMAADAMALVNMSQEGIESWLADAQADYDAALARFSEQCESLRALNERLQAKQREIAADSEVQIALAEASAGGKTTYRFGRGPKAIASLKKLESEESKLRQLQDR